MRFIDLHTHSTASDGSLSPDQLIHQAVKAGLSAVALTDHDTVDGLALAEKTAKGQIEFIPGIELAAFDIDREIHIVGLFIDYSNKTLIEKTEMIAADRAARNLEMIRRLQDVGIDITPESLAKEEGSGILTRANFGSYLYKVGAVSTYREAFSKYIGQDCPCYVARTHISVKDAVDTIKNAGGLAILAHPLMYGMTETEIDRRLPRLKDIGIDGIEVYYSRNIGFDTLTVRHLADKHQLLYSGGSDFHGSYKPDLSLGTGTGTLYIPYDVLTKLKKR